MRAWPGLHLSPVIGKGDQIMEAQDTLKVFLALAVLVLVSAVSYGIYLVVR